MTFARTAVQDWATSNKLYVNAIVTFYTVLDGEKTEILADLYAGLTGSTQVANPQTLDSYGKLRQPVYFDEPVIASVTGLGNTPDHDTGVIAPGYFFTGNGSPEGVVTATRGLYIRLDGGTSTTLYVKESGTGNTGWVPK